MIETVLPVTGKHVVWLAALHAGISFGWHAGTGIKRAEAKIRRERINTWGEAGVTFLSHAVHHYDVGFMLVALSLAAIFGIQDWALFGSLFILGFGSGLMYNDREDNPPEGILKHTVKKIKGERTRSNT